MFKFINYSKNIGHLLLEIINNPIVSPTTASNNTDAKDENTINLEDDEEEVRRLENVDPLVVPFTVPNQKNEKQNIDIEQLEYMRRLLNN